MLTVTIPKSATPKDTAEHMAGSEGEAIAWVKVKNPAYERPVIHLCDAIPGVTNLVCCIAFGSQAPVRSVRSTRPLASSVASVTRRWLPFARSKPATSTAKPVAWALSLPDEA